MGPTLTSLLSTVFRLLYQRTYLDAAERSGDCNQDTYNFESFLVKQKTLEIFSDVGQLLNNAVPSENDTTATSGAPTKNKKSAVLPVSAPFSAKLLWHHGYQREAPLFLP